MNQNADVIHMATFISKKNPLLSLFPKWTFKKKKLNAIL